MFISIWLHLCSHAHTILSLCLSLPLSFLLSLSLSFYLSPTFVLPLLPSNNKSSPPSATGVPPPSSSASHQPTCCTFRCHSSHSVLVLGAQTELRIVFASSHLEPILTSLLKDCPLPRSAQPPCGTRSNGCSGHAFPPRQMTPSHSSMWILRSFPRLWLNRRPCLNPRLSPRLSPRLCRRRASPRLSPHLSPRLSPHLSPRLSLNKLSSYTPTCSHTSWTKSGPTPPMIP